LSRDFPINPPVVDLCEGIGANPATKTGASPKLPYGNNHSMQTGEARPVEKLKAVHRGRKISNLTVSLILSFVVTAAAQPERTNQEGRILGPAPVVATPTLFDTPQADAIVSGL
jgi:hypothetical protein